MNLNTQDNKKLEYVEKEKKNIINEIARELDNKVKQLVDNFAIKADGE